MCKRSPDLGMVISALVVWVGICRFGGNVARVVCVHARRVVVRLLPLLRGVVRGIVVVVSSCVTRKVASSLLRI